MAVIRGCVNLWRIQFLLHVMRVWIFCSVNYKIQHVCKIQKLTPKESSQIFEKQNTDKESNQSKLVKVSSIIFSKV